MKKSIFSLSVITVLLSFMVNWVGAQNYQLLPDSCTFCFFRSMGNGQSYNGHYRIYQNEDTIYNGKSYTKVKSEDFFLAGVRQDGDKLLGILHDDTSEYKLMDWSGNYGDTIRGLYSYSRYYYDAIIKYKGEVTLPSGHVHRYMTLEGICAYDTFSNGYVDTVRYNNWKLRWDEKGLCGENVPYATDDSISFNLRGGGIFYGYQEESFVWEYLDPVTCTADTIYDSYTQATGPCQQCEPVHPNASLEDHKQLVVNFYPNPISRGQPLTIELENKQLDEVRICDLQGKKVYSTPVLGKNKYAIHKSFEPGLYLVLCYDNGNILSRQKLIVK